MDRMSTLVADCVNALIVLRTSSDAAPSDAEQPRDRFRSLVEEFQRRAPASGYTRDDAMDVAYALVAAADEFALRGPDPLREAWMREPLQMAFFGENRAGEGFFVRLDRLLRARSRHDVLWVYHVCLLLGFEGRYGLEGEAQTVRAIERRVHAELYRRYPVKRLSPRGRRPHERRPRHRRRSLGIALGLLGVVFAFALGLVLKCALDGEAKSSLAELSQ